MSRCLKEADIVDILLLNIAFLRSLFGAVIKSPRLECSSCFNIYSNFPQNEGKLPAYFNISYRRMKFFFLIKIVKSCANNTHEIHHYHIFSGVSSGSGSSDTASNEDKCDSPTPSATPSCGSSNTVKRRPESRSTPRPRHLKPKKDIYKSNPGNLLKPKAP